MIRRPSGYIGTFMAICLCTLFSIATAQPSQWVRTNGPTGGTAHQIIRTEEGLLFVALQKLGVYRSADGGATWASQNYCLGNKDVNCLLYTKSHTLLTGTQGGLFRGTDTGSCWQPGVGLTCNEITGLTMTSNGMVYAATWGNGIFKSTDDGATWSPSGTATAFMKVYCITRNASDRLFIGTYGNGAFQSRDGGATWLSLGVSGYVYSLGMSVSGVLFAGTSNDLRRSTDLGQTWEVCSNGIQADNGVSALAFSAAGEVLAGASGSVENHMYRSTDDGISWATYDNGLSLSYLADILVTPSGDLFAGTQGDGVYKRGKTDTSWTQVSDGMKSSLVYSLVTLHDGTVLAGCYNGLFRSTNDGVDWTPSRKGITSPTIEDLLSYDATTVFAAVWNAGVYTSTDAGNTWKKSNGMTSTRPTCIEKDSAGNIYVGTQQQGVFVSTDRGGTWQKRTNGIANQNVEAIAADDAGGLLLATMSAGVFRSSNQGVDWISSNTGLTRTFIRALNIHGREVLAGSDTGMFRSTDGGLSWSPSGIFSDTWVAAFYRSEPDTIMFATGRGMFLLTDNGTNWISCNNGLTGSTVNCLAVDKGGTVLAGTNEDGVFRFAPTPETTEITVGTTPAGRLFSVDGIPYNGQQTFMWQAGGAHDLVTPAKQSGASGVRYIWKTWGAGQSNPFHYVVPSLAPATVTATFDTEDSITVNAGAGGTVHPGNGWYKKGSPVQLTAAPLPGYKFDCWEGVGANSYNGKDNPATITVANPLSETALFISASAADGVPQPRELALYQNTPNPCSDRTMFSFALPRAQSVTLVITDLLGRVLARPANSVHLNEGVHHIAFNVSAMQPGMYLFQLETSNATRAGSMLVFR